ncbi:MAG: PEGA domain-containing protein [Myxococcales bacterium]|nr:PEGA domain-containing protein [Myxococcales bacterium]
MRTETAVAPTPRVVPKSPPEEATPIAAVGYLSIGSEPAADVLIDGSFVKRTPMLRYPINAGQHTVKLIAVGADAKTFKVTVTSGQEARKIWNFDDSSWVDE